MMVCRIGGLPNWWPAELVACRIGGLPNWWSSVIILQLYIIAQQHKSYRAGIPLWSTQIIFWDSVCSECECKGLVESMNLPE